MTEHVLKAYTYANMWSLAVLEIIWERMATYEFKKKSSQQFILELRQEKSKTFGDRTWNTVEQKHNLICNWWWESQDLSIHNSKEKTCKIVIILTWP